MRDQYFEFSDGLIEISAAWDFDSRISNAEIIVRPMPQRAKIAPIEVVVTCLACPGREAWALVRGRRPALGSSWFSLNRDRLECDSDEWIAPGRDALAAIATSWTKCLESPREAGSPAYFVISESPLDDDGWAEVLRGLGAWPASKENLVSSVIAAHVDGVSFFLDTADSGDDIHCRIACFLRTDVLGRLVSCISSRLGENKY